MTKTIALAGTSQSSAKLVNDEPPEVERWGMGSTRIWIKKMDAYFEVHAREHLMRRSGNAYFDHLFWMQGFDGPIYMLEPDVTIRNAVRLPIEEMTKRFFPYGEHPYFTSTVSYMLAMAIMEEPDEIKLFGIDFSTEEERTHQRQGTEYFIGWAMGMGIKVVVPDTSPIMKGALYGAGVDRVNQDTLQERIRNQDTTKMRLAEGLIAVRGRIQEAEETRDAEKSAHRKKKLRVRITELRGEEVILEGELTSHRGAMSENQRWVNEEIGLQTTSKIPASATPMVLDLSKVRANGAKAKVEAK